VLEQRPGQSCANATSAWSRRPLRLACARA
jgi:hypothetical protein